jgi:hypothetical protein
MKPTGPPDSAGVRALLHDVLRPIARIDPGWLHEHLPQALLQRFLNRVAQQRRHATRLINRQLQAQGEQPIWGGAADAPGWLAEPAAAQRQRATLLGALACVPWLRGVVAREQVAQLAAALGAGGYRRVLADTGLEVEGLERAVGLAALEARRTHEHLMSVGAALLELALQHNTPATRFRLRLVLPPAVWRARPQPIAADAAVLAAAIERCAGAIERCAAAGDSVTAAGAPR